MRGRNRIRWREKRPKKLGEGETGEKSREEEKEMLAVGRTL